MKIQNFGEWEGDRPRGHHPPACTCVVCTERRLGRGADEETHRAREYDRRVRQSRARGQGQRPSGGRPPTQKPQRTLPASGQDGPGGRKPSARIWLGFLGFWGVVAVLVAVILYLNNPIFGAPQSDEPIAAAALIPTDEPPANTPAPTPASEPAVLAPAPEQPRPQSVPSRTMEPVTGNPAPGPTPMPSPEGHPSEAPGAVLPAPTPATTVPISLVPTSSTPPTPTAAAPTLPPTTAPSPTPVPVPHLRHMAEKEYMLELINEERERVGVPPVELGANNAAQLHAESALEHCFLSHWGVDGLKPYMRYSLAGGYQPNGENASGISYCYKPTDGYRAIESIEHEIDKMMDGWMGSPGHRRNLLDRWHKKVNIGLAWNRYNSMGYQHFEGDYVEYTALPKIEDGHLSFEGRVRNAAVFGEGRFLPIAIYYDQPPHDLTVGQVAGTYCYDQGEHIAFVRKPLPSNMSYVDDTTIMQQERCRDPYDASSDSPAPSSPAKARGALGWAASYRDQVVSPLLRVPKITASKWIRDSVRFSVEVDLNDVLEAHGPGVYTVLLWGTLGGEAEVISEYAIFQEVPTPSGYD